MYAVCSAQTLQNVFMLQHKIAVNVIALPLSPIICERSIYLLYMCELFFFSFMKIWLLFKRPLMAESNSWQWFCQLSWTVGLQPLPGAALTGFEYFTWSKSATLDLICSIGFISASCDSSTPFASFLLHKIAQILSKSETFDMVWERVLRKKMNLWFDNDWCISCLIPLFVVLCSEKMERSLEMTEKAV